MNGLTQKQRKALKTACARYYKKHNDYPQEVVDLDEYKTIEKMNDSEIFHQCANRIILDWNLKKTED